MQRFRKFTITRIMLAIGFSLSASDGLAQGSKELVGAWTLVSITVNQGGQKKIEPFEGRKPKKRRFLNRQNPATNDLYPHLNFGFVLWMIWASWRYDGAVMTG